MTCPEQEIWLPSYEGNTCWFISTNFALFHNKTAYLNAFFNNLDPAADKDIVPKFFQSIYNYYTNPDPDVNQMETNYKKIDEDRKKLDDLQQELNTSTFQINTTKQQDASDYLNSLLNKTGLHKHIQLIQIPNGIPYINHACWDMLLYHDAKSKNTSSIKIQKSTQKLIIASGFRYTGKEPYEMAILNSVMLPVEGKTKLVSFQLSGIVDGQPGHFNASVSCDSTSELLYYTGGFNPGRIQDKVDPITRQNPFVFANFEKLMKEKPWLRKKTCFLIYEKETIEQRIAKFDKNLQEWVTKYDTEMSKGRGTISTTTPDGIFTFPDDIDVDGYFDPDDIQLYKTQLLPYIQAIKQYIQDFKLHHKVLNENTKIVVNGPPATPLTTLTYEPANRRYTLPPLPALPPQPTF